MPAAALITFIKILLLTVDEFIRTFEADAPIYHEDEQSKLPAIDVLKCALMCIEEHNLWRENEIVKNNVLPSLQKKASKLNITFEPDLLPFHDLKRIQLNSGRNCEVDFGRCIISCVLPVLEAIGTLTLDLCMERKPSKASFKSSLNITIGDMTTTYSNRMI